MPHFIPPSLPQASDTMVRWFWETLQEADPLYRGQVLWYVRTHAKNNMSDRPVE